MCILSDVSLKGLFLTSTSSPLSNPVFAINGARSEMRLPKRYSVVRLVKLDSDAMFVMLLL